MISPRRAIARTSGPLPIRKSAEAARREVLAWAQRRSGGRLPREAWHLKDFEYLSGGRNSIAVRVDNNRADISAIRADDPDKSVPGRVWTTEVVVGLTRAAMWEGSRTPSAGLRPTSRWPEDEMAYGFCCGCVRQKVAHDVR